MNRVLVIDDDTELREVLAEVLRDAGYEVAEAAEGRQGLQMQRRAPADLVISDIFMPEQEGMETMHRLREAYPDLKIVAISGGTSVDGRYDYLPVAGDIGADRCLRKPFRVSRLISTIRELIGGGRARI